ncbi:unnamed protein product [Orchesella dallaii]|uniref:G2/M phase-specific E3 ubiquitin-protein ligase n=1 Tax=Orchesella dallaii TaxID=48710 RepID=A0ABP1S828_9HEXA
MESDKNSLFKTVNPLVTTISVEDPNVTCILCRSSKVDEVNLGPLYSLEEVTVHYFCVLFTSALCQNGEDFEGILGFMPEDIKKESRRASYLKCAFCHINGASVGCCEKKCKISYHFPCGLANQVTFQFLGNYESFCIDHSRYSCRIPEKDHKCPVCMCNISGKELYVSASCCKSAILHKSCVQRMAFSAGYFFKCPTCNSSNLFKKEIRCQGVFIPEQDASWELEPNAFQDLLYQYSKCDMEDCQCPRGREYGANKGDWLLARCRICGSAGVHRQCGNLLTIANWACVPCLEVEARADKEKKAAKPQVSVLEGHPIPSTSFSLEDIATPREEDNDSGILARLRIANQCRDYFPFGRAQIEKFVKAGSYLPDWRQRELNIVLIDVLNNDLGIGKVPEPQPLPVTPVISRAEPVPPVISNVEPVTPVISNAEPVTPVISRAEPVTPVISRAEPVPPVISRAEPGPCSSNLIKVPAASRHRTRAQAKKKLKRLRRPSAWQKGVIKLVNYKRTGKDLEKKKNDSTEVEESVLKIDDKRAKQRAVGIRRESVRLNQKNGTKVGSTRSGMQYQFA